jgi:enoyl-CoA hydratase/carnithine racemase
MNERVSIAIADGVADVRLARPDKMNALDPAMFHALSAAGTRLMAEPALRAVVLSGEGRAFCAGLDMASFAAMDAKEAGPLRDLKARSHGLANLFQHVAWVWREVPVPVIAAVHGVAFGGGFQIMLGADMRYMAPDTQLSIMEIKWGLVPDMAGTLLMRGLARDDIVRELTYTGHVFSGTEAQQYGFATRLCDDPRAGALATAREIAAKSPDAIRAAKRLLNAVPFRTAADGLMAESVEQQALIGSPNQLEAVYANMGKRAPRFADP